MDRLARKVALITGGAGAMGRTAAKLFAAEGARVLIVDRDERGLEMALAEIGSDEVSEFVADVTSAKDNLAMVEAAEARYGGLDIVLANAGIEGDQSPLLEISEESFDEVMNVNLKGPFHAIRAAAPALERRGGGSIVVTSSIASTRGGVAAYTTSKTAVTGLVRSAAKQLAPMNIRVNSINPGPTSSPMLMRIDEKVREQLLPKIPMGRFAQLEEIASVMLFLASSDSSFVTGKSHLVDGGEAAN